MNQTTELKKEQSTEPLNGQKRIPEKDLGSIVKLIKRIAFDLFLLLAIYVPFGLMTMFASFYSKGTRQGPKWSVSTLSWKEGNYWMLVFYVLFVIGFFAYQILLFSKLSGRKQKLLKVMMYVASAFLFIGSCLPVDKNYNLAENTGWTNSTTKFWDLMHCYLCQAGTGIFGVILVIMVIKFCIDTVNHQVSKQRIIVLACIVAATIIWGLIEFGVASYYEVWSTFMALCFASYLTINYELAEKKQVALK